MLEGYGWYDMDGRDEEQGGVKASGNERKSNMQNE